MNDNHYPAGNKRGGQFAPKSRMRSAVEKYSDTPQEDLISMGIDRLSLSDFIARD